MELPLRNTNRRILTRSARIHRRIAGPVGRRSHLIPLRLKASNILILLRLPLITKAPAPPQAMLSNRRTLLITLIPVTHLLKLPSVPLIPRIPTLPRNHTLHPTTGLQATSRRLTSHTPRHTNRLQLRRNRLKNTPAQ